LRRRYNIRPGHEIIVRVYAETEPFRDTTVVIEPRLLTTGEISSGEFPIDFERVIVARTLFRMESCRWFSLLAGGEPVI